jgi:hypothetical protein
MAASFLSTALIGMLMLMENRKRNAAAAAGDQDGVDSTTIRAIEGFTDHTDRENKAFRYVL